MNYLLFKDEVWAGPFTTEQIKNMIRTSGITIEDYVCQEGTQKTVQIKQVSDLLSGSSVINPTSNTKNTLIKVSLIGIVALIVVGGIFYNLNSKGSYLGSWRGDLYVMAKGDSRNRRNATLLITKDEITLKYNKSVFTGTYKVISNPDFPSSIFLSGLLRSDVITVPFEMVYQKLSSESEADNLMEKFFQKDKSELSHSVVRIEINEDSRRLLFKPGSVTVLGSEGVLIISDGMFESTDQKH